MADVKRSVRVAERVRAELAHILSRKVKDPRVLGVIVSRVEMTDDLGLAKIYFRLLSGDEAAAKNAEVGLGRASPVMRSELTKALALRTAPELRFFYDTGLDHRSRVEELLIEIERDKKKSES